MCTPVGTAEAPVAAGAERFFSGKKTGEETGIPQKRAGKGNGGNAVFEGIAHIGKGTHTAHKDNGQVRFRGKIRGTGEEIWAFRLSGRRRLVAAELQRLHAFPLHELGGSADLENILVVFHGVGAVELYEHGKFIPAGDLDACHDLQKHPQPVIHAAAVGIPAVIVLGIEHLAEQVAVGGMDLHAVKAKGFCHLRGADKGVHNALQYGKGHVVRGIDGKSAVCSLGADAAVTQLQKHLPFSAAGSVQKGGLPFHEAFVPEGVLGFAGASLGTYAGVGSDQCADGGILQLPVSVQLVGRDKAFLTCTEKLRCRTDEPVGKRGIFQLQGKKLGGIGQHGHHLVVSIPYPGGIVKTESALSGKNHGKGGADVVQYSLEKQTRRTEMKRMTARFLHRFSALIFAAALFAVNALPARAAQSPEPPEIDSCAAVVYETNTGRILYAKDAETQYYPASTTKILTALIAIERLELDEIIHFTDYSISCIADEARHFELQPGEEMPLYSCLQALLIPSCNEAASSIAEHIAGSEEAFAELMNERARQAGAVNSHFIYPHGLQDSMHYVTAADMALILADCVQYDVYREISGSWECEILDAQDSTYYYDTHNALLRPDSDMNRDLVVCSKTGHTWYAGYALMSYGVQDGMEITCAVLGGSSYESVVADTVRLCEYAFDTYRIYDSTAAATVLVRSVLGNCDVTLNQPKALLTPEMPAKPVTSELGEMRYLGYGEFEGNVILTLPDGTEQNVWYTARVTDEGE